MNMNRWMLLVLVMVLGNWAKGQDLIVQGVTPDLYLNHTVAPKETWYSIGKMYNVAPKNLAASNGLTVSAPLETGRKLKVPLTTANFSQADPSGAVNELAPVYHIVGDREWMYRVSVNHNKVPIEKLEKWNNVSKDDVKAGTKLIVGYLKSGNAAAAATASAQKPAQAQKPAAQAPKAVQTTAPQTTQAGSSAPDTAPQTASRPTTMPGTGGYFKTEFEGTGSKSSGVSGIFKSTSGWKDGKYYALMNNVTVGTIVRIVFPKTNKTVYAKVLGELPDMKESEGLALRISDAAANELGAAATGKFSVDVSY